MRLDPRVRAVLVDAIAAMDGDPATASAFRVPDGVLVTLDAFRRARLWRFRPDTAAAKTFFYCDATNPASMPRMPLAPGL